MKIILPILFFAGLMPAQTFNPTQSISAAGSANSFQGGYTFAYKTSGTPWDGSLISYGGLDNRYDTQINASYYSPNISFRTRNGDQNTWNGWQELATRGSNIFVGDQIVNGKLTVGGAVGTDNFTINGGHASTTFLMHAENGGNPNADLTLWASEPGSTYSGTGIGNNVRNYFNGAAFQRIVNTRGASYIRLLENELKFNVISNSGINKEMLFVNSGGASVAGDFKSTSGTLTSVRSSNEGGALILINTSKLGAAASNWSIYNMTGNYGNSLQFWNYSPDGSKGGSRLKISDEGNMALYGKLEAREIKVTTTPTADFVFEENYNLPKLEDVEKHIKEKKHLPEIASAKEMEVNGVNVGEFQIKLLQKIEELTLYTIEQNKLNKEQAALLQKQIEVNKQLESRIYQLEKNK